MKYLLLFLVVAGIIVDAPASAQMLTDSLDAVEVKAKSSSGGIDEKRAYAPGMQGLRFDSTMLARNNNQNLGALLARELPVFVKSYGFNSLATLQLRGASAAQTLVLWEGVPLANAALGVADLSAIPVYGLSAAEIVYGSSTALFGSGNVGGALRISMSSLPDSSGFSGSLFGGTGSFSQWSGGGKASFKKKRWSGTAAAFGATSRNNFSFQKENGEEGHMPNNSSVAGNLSGALQYAASRSDAITAHAWYSQSARQLPPATFEDTSAQKLNTSALRTLLHWRHTGKTRWYAKGAWLKEMLDYENPLIALYSTNKAAVLFGEAGLESGRKSGGTFLVFATGQYSALLGGGGEAQRRLSFTACAAQPFVNNRGSVSVCVRAEDVDGNSYLLPGINAAWRIAPFILLRLNAQRTYRVPTLNELYYNPGGNPDLKPEQGWNGDAGWRVSAPLHARWKLLHEAAVYYRKIDNWVAWFGGSIWTPHNIATVRSAGFEMENELSYMHSEIFQLRLRAHLALSSSITTASDLPGDGSIGAQIPYAPKTMAGGSIGVTCSAVYLAYAHSYTGLRFITTDQSAEIKSYDVGRLSGEYSLSGRAGRFIFRAACNNLFNSRYETIAGRPAPLRYGECSLEWQWN